MFDVIALAECDDAIKRALEFARCAHAAVGQKRKYTGDAYINHPIAVANIVGDRPHNKYMIQAALLHDVVEDTTVTIDQIDDEFGPFVAVLVSNLTDVSKPTDGNRAVRKELDFQHTAGALPEAKTIKLADLLHNTTSIVKYDPGFAVIYMKEKRRLLDVLTQGDPVLWAKAKGIVDAYFLELGPKQD